MNLDKLRQQLHNLPQSGARIGITDLDGIIRGKWLHKDKLIGSLDDGLGFCDVIFGWDMADRTYDGATLTGPHTGYPDRPARIDPATFRTIPWLHDQPFLLADYYHHPTPACPRSLLRRVIDRAEGMGLRPKMAQEFEWFNFAETPQTLADKKYRDPQPLTPGMHGYSLLRPQLAESFVADLLDLLPRFGIPLEGLHTETGPGVYEAAISYTDALEAADRAVLFKLAVKQLAYRHGIVASFMAKWSGDLPGCGGHIHQSLWDAKGENNQFAGEKGKLPELLRHYLAGLLHCLPELLPLYAPNINSYKRLVEGAWAPTTVSWGHDNRTLAVRHLSPYASGSRIEMRVPGADVNPYCAMAACLASGLYGIENQLPLSEARTGDGYATDAPPLPRSLSEATARMKNSGLARQLLGDGFVDHFVYTREWEVEQYRRAVTDWELQRYFELA